eukprot:g8925.t1
MELVLLETKTATAYHWKYELHHQRVILCCKQTTNRSSFNLQAVTLTRAESFMPMVSAVYSSVLHHTIRHVEVQYMEKMESIFKLTRTLPQISQLLVVPMVEEVEYVKILQKHLVNMEEACIAMLEHVLLTLLLWKKMKLQLEVVFFKTKVNVSHFQRYAIQPEVGAEAFSAANLIHVLCFVFQTIRLQVVAVVGLHSALILTLETVFFLKTKRFTVIKDTNLWDWTKTMAKARLQLTQISQMLTMIIILVFGIKTMRRPELNTPEQTIVASTAFALNLHLTNTALPNLLKTTVCSVCMNCHRAQLVCTASMRLFHQNALHHRRLAVAYAQIRFEVKQIIPQHALLVQPVDIHARSIELLTLKTVIVSRIALENQILHGIIHKMFQSQEIFLCRSMAATLAMRHQALSLKLVGDDGGTIVVVLLGPQRYQKVWERTMKYTLKWMVLLKKKERTICSFRTIHQRSQKLFRHPSMGGAQYDRILETKLIRKLSPTKNAPTITSTCSIAPILAGRQFLSLINSAFIQQDYFLIAVEKSKLLLLTVLAMYRVTATMLLQLLLDQLLKSLGMTRALDGRVLQTIVTINILTMKLSGASMTIHSVPQILLEAMEVIGRCKKFD